MIVSGIYKITSPTGRIYIGQSIDIYKRGKDYARVSSSLKQQKRLYNSIKKYSPDRHIFEIIEECGFEDLLCRERHWQDHYDVLSKMGMNCVLTKCGEVPMQTIKNMEVYDLFYGITYSGVNEAVRKLGITTIKDKLNGRLYNDTNLVYKEDFDNNIFREKKVFKKYSPVIDIKTFVTYPNIDIVAEIYNISRETLSDYLKEVYPNPTNLRFLNTDRKSTRKSTRGKKIKDKLTGIIYNSITEAALKTGVNRCSLRDYLSGKNPNKTNLEYYE